MEKMKNCKAVWAIDVHTGLPLALGKHPRKGGVNPPICYAVDVLFFLPVSIKHLMKKLMGVGLVPAPCLPMSNSFFYLRKHEDMLYWGGEFVTCKEFEWS